MPAIAAPSCNSGGQVVPTSSTKASALAPDCHYKPPPLRSKGSASVHNYYYESLDVGTKFTRNRDAEWIPSPVNGSSPSLSPTGHRTHWALGVDHSPVFQQAASVLTYNVQTYRLSQPTWPAMSSPSLSPTGPDSATPLGVLSPP